MFPIERNSEFAEDLRSKFPDFHIQTDRDGLLRELRGVFEEKDFTFRVGHGFASLELEKRGHKLKICSDRAVERGLHWNHPMTVVLNDHYFFGIDLPSQAESAETVLQQQARIAFKHGIEVLERFHHFLQERLPEVYLLCTRQKEVTDESFSIFDLKV